jgi:RecA-family ATPase
VKELETYRVSDLYGKHLERPPVIVLGMIPAGLTILAGAPKRGKSWLALKLALDVAAGNPFLGLPTTQGDVLYLDLESRQYRIQERVGKLIAGKAPAALQACHMADRLDEDLLEQLRLWCEQAPHPVLIIIDTLGRVKGGARRGENSYESDTRILGELQSFALQHSLAVVCVHHLRKSLGEGDFFERISGSMGISGACDSVMVLQGKRGEPESVLSVSSRDFEPMELVLGFERGMWTLRSTDSETYRQEQAYLHSEGVRNTIRLMERVERWEGTAADLLGDLLGVGLMPADCTRRRERNSRRTGRCCAIGTGSCSARGGRGNGAG